MQFLSRRALTVVLLGFGLTAADASKSAAQSVPVEVPRSWSLAEIAAQTPPLEPAGRVYVLAWSIIEDERPVRVESCLALKVLGDGRHSLAHLYRRPDEEPSVWRIASTHVAADDPKTRPGRWLFHTKQFAARPTNRQVYAALEPDEVNWKFALENSWRFVGCGVCEESWRAALGEKPTRFFGK